MWPDLLRQVQGMKRSTWMIISANAQVHELAGGVLRLAFSNQGTARGFGNGQHAEVVAAAVEQLLGATVRVEAVEGAPSTGGSGSTTSAAATAPASSTTRPVPATSGGWPDTAAPSAASGPPDWFEQAPTDDDAPPPDVPPSGGPPSAPEPQRSAAEPAPGRMSRAEQMARATAPAKDPALDTPSDDDPDLDDAGPAGTSVIEQMLGGQVIDVEHERR